MKPRNQTGFNDVNGSGLITWSGACINCLGIKPGDNLNSIVYTIAEKLCLALEPQDLSTLTLQCALDIIPTDEPSNRTLVNVLQLLLDNDCKLKDLIDGIQNQIDGLSEDSLTLNLNCLRHYYEDNNGNVSLPYTTESILQNLIDDLCELSDTVTTLSTTIVDIREDLDDHINNHPQTPEVIVSNCISNAKPVSTAINELAQDYCLNKDNWGLDTEVQTAKAKQTPEMDTLMAGVVGWIPSLNVSSLADAINNLYLLTENYRVRIAANEECCASGCDDLTVGFLTDFDGTTVILQFTSGAGTFIPTGFVDNGSTVTISDSSGNSVTYSIPIAQNYESEALDLSMFTIGTTLTFSLDVKMKLLGDNDEIIISCQKCVGKDVKYLNDDCCVITATSTVTIIYQTCGITT